MIVPALINRVARVTVFRADGFFANGDRGIVIDSMRVEFRIEKTIKSEPNKAEVTLTNLNQESRNACDRRPLRVIVEAGYAGVPRMMFVGDVGPGSGSRHDGADWSTKLLVGDGLRAFAHARVNRSYAPGTATLTILDDVARSLQLEVPIELRRDPALKAGIPSSETATGFSSDELERLLAPYGYSFSFQNGRLQILKDETAAPGSEREVSQATGMIGSPESKTPDKGDKRQAWTIRSLLYPEIFPGGKIRVRSQSLKDAILKVERVVHTGDTRGEPWHTEIEARAL